jgi:hypothetical protein
MDDNRRVLAIAGGHTKTHVCILECGRIRASRIEQGLSLYRESYSDFCSSLRKVIDSFEPTFFDRICEHEVTLILPGIDDEASCVESLKESGFCPKFLRIIDDTACVLLAALGSVDGICAFAGSGAAVLSGPELREAGSIPGSLRRIGKYDGYGPLIGDYGSGFRFASECISAAFRMSESYDIVFKQSPDPNATQALELLQWLADFDEELTDISSWTRDLLSNRTSFMTKISRMAKPLIAKVEDAIKDQSLESQIRRRPGCALAIVTEALERAAIQMANTVKLALNRQPDDIQVPIICHGGIFFHSSYYFKCFRDQLRTYAGTIQLAKYDYVLGGLCFTDETNEPNLAYHREVTAAVDLLVDDDPSKAVLYRKFPT